MNIFYILFIFYYSQQILFTLRVSSFLSLLNDDFVDIVDDVGFSQFFPEAEYTTLIVHIILVLDSEAKSAWFAQLLKC